MGVVVADRQADRQSHCHPIALEDKYRVKRNTV